MSKQLVLAEKPSVGRDIARVLGCGQKGDGYLEGPGYVVTWALGHLVTLADPEAYGAGDKAWRLDELPLLPGELKLVVIKQTGRQFNAVKRQLERRDVSEIIIATDAGREGELVARWILDKAAVHKPVKRLWISSVTDKAIKEGFAGLKPGRAYENLYSAAAARAAADWFVGINATRALTCKHNAQLSCGRVQTPTLAIIARREREIQEFTPRPYYGIKAAAERLELTWRRPGGETRVFDRSVCAGIAAALAGRPAKITAVDRTQKKTFAPQLYNLTELQRDAHKLFQFSAKETLAVLQKLYETHKILTYPRTDSRYLPSDIVDTLKERLKACGVGPYTKPAFKIAGKIKAAKHFIDDAKVSDHHAVIPTEQFVHWTALSDKERKIYDLAVRRFLAVLYPPFEYEQTVVRAEIGRELFVARGKVVRNLGWKELYQGAPDDEEAADGVGEQLLPALGPGDVMPVARLTITQGLTKPPAPFNEASLLSAMENPLPYMNGEDQALQRTLNEAGGLGTVATRADIIEKLLAGFLIEKRGQDIWTTAKGRQLLELAPEELRSPALTAQWEQKLTAIASGKLETQSFLTEIKTYTRAAVRDIKNSEEKFRHDNMTRAKCPDCGKYLLEVNGKRGKMLVCQDRACGYRRGVSVATNARCPNCHKRMELRGEGEGRLFVCVCGFREKLSAFQKKKEGEGGRISKSEVSRYLKEQRRQEKEPMNTALADALAKLKLE